MDTGRLRMPPTGKLKEDQLEDIRAWIVGGAAVPAATAPAAAPKRESAVPNLSPASPRKHREFTFAEKSFWSRGFQIPLFPLFSTDSSFRNSRKGASNRVAEKLSAVGAGSKVRTLHKLNATQSVADKTCFRCRLGTPLHVNDNVKVKPRIRQCFSNNYR